MSDLDEQYDKMTEKSKMSKKISVNLESDFDEQFVREDQVK